MNNRKCKNCGYTVHKRFCSECGQKDSELLKFKILVKEFFNEFLDLDSRLFLTLKYLITKPGFLTTEYWQGRKSRYSSPFRIYLITSLLYVFFNSLYLNNPKENNQIKASSIEQEKLEDDISIYSLAWLVTKNNIDYIFDKQSENLDLFLFMPFFSLGLKISNRKHKHLYFAHYFIATFHIWSALNLLSIIIIIFNIVLPNYELLINIFNVAVPIYILLAIKHIFNISLIKSIIKTIFIGASAFSALISLIIIVFSSSIILHYLELI